MGSHKTAPRRVVQAEGDPLLRRGACSHYRADTLRDCNARVPILLRRGKIYGPRISRHAAGLHRLEQDLLIKLFKCEPEIVCHPAVAVLLGLGDPLLVGGTRFIFAP
jgi:hypothetical protein